ncbi:hypothetical protein AGR7C_pAt0050 [Agrobacterium deltaense Zutra 3/1]|uniref:Uncharacterized protein n=1 Tax=Agrobacterium deltaense Zutra 3/1 TaxID=1183427 RepID=A0A1S7S2A3_9HYPH|nr:hypothetical protein AGR7C_pAt0050 [Agrobacterium deltaense Zutra 3/1]
MAPLTVTLETDLDLDEERDLDCELQGELATPEEVTDHLTEDAEPAAGGAEELSEAFHTVSPCRLRLSRGEDADRKGRLHRLTGTRVEDLLNT